MYFIKPSDVYPVDIDTYCENYCINISMKLDSCTPVIDDNYMVSCYSESCIDINTGKDRSNHTETDYSCVMIKNYKERLIEFENITVSR